MKKKKRILTKAQREAILRSLQKDESSSQILPALEAKPDQTITLAKPTTNQTVLPDQTTTNQELKRIAWVMTVVLLLLAVTLIINLKTPYLAQAGSYLIHKLQLT